MVCRAIRMKKSFGCLRLSGSHLSQKEIYAAAEARIKKLGGEHTPHTSCVLQCPEAALQHQKYTYRKDKFLSAPVSPKEKKSNQASPITTTSSSHLIFMVVASLVDSYKALSNSFWSGLWSSLLRGSCSRPTAVIATGFWSLTPQLQLWPFRDRNSTVPQSSAVKLQLVVSNLLRTKVTSRLLFIFQAKKVLTFPQIFWLCMRNSKEKCKDKQVKPNICLQTLDKHRTGSITPRGLITY